MTKASLSGGRNTRTIIVLGVVLVGLGIGSAAGIVLARDDNGNSSSQTGRSLDLTSVNLAELVSIKDLDVAVALEVDEPIDRATLELLVDGDRVDRRTDSEQWDLEWTAPDQSEVDLVLRETTGGTETAPYSVSLTTTTTTTTTTAPPTEPATAARPSSRTGTLNAQTAVIRDRPSLGAVEVDRLRNRLGAELVIEGENVDGWYRISFPADGWIFGTFVLPPDPGLAVAITRDGSEARLLNSAGQRLNIANASGDKVLVVDRSGSLWQVLLADGTAAFVNPSEFNIV